jgi:hypothetical protein
MGTRNQCISDRRKRRFFEKMNEIFTPPKRARQPTSLSDPRRLEAALPRIPRGAKTVPPRPDNPHSISPQRSITDKNKNPSHIAPITSSKDSQLHDRPDSKTVSPILLNERIFVVPLGADISQKRMKVWESQIHSLGGHVETTFNELVTICIVSSLLAKDKLLSFLKVDDVPSRMRVYTPDWITFIIQHGALPEHDHSFRWSKDDQEEEKLSPTSLVAQQVPPATALYESRPEEVPPEEPERNVVESSHCLPEENRARRSAAEDDDMEHRREIFYRNNPHMREVHARENESPKQINQHAFVCVNTTRMRK